MALEAHSLAKVAALPIFAVGTLFAFAACGPSFAAVHNGEARFEHCYALDERSNVSIDSKRECWREWRDMYTYAQTKDRVEYADSRFKALSDLPALPTDEALMAGAPGEGERNRGPLPAPTSAFAPPVSTVSEMCLKNCSIERTRCDDACRPAVCPPCAEKESACVAKCGK